MNFTAVTRFVAVIWIVLGVGILLSAIPSFLLKESDLQSLIVIGLSSSLTGLLIILITRRNGDFKTREAFLGGSLAWITAGFIGALPFYFGGQLTFTDSLFESFSGFTTTGATVIDNIEIIPHGLLLWRSLTQCLGGMGIVVMSLAILPLLGYGGVELFQTEVVGPVKDKLTPRVRETARILWKVYALLIVAAAITYWIIGMPLFDAICHSLTSVATGGYSTRNASIGDFNNPLLNWSVILFMAAGGTNFALHVNALRGNPSLYMRESEFRYWLGIITLSMVVISIIHLTQSSQYLPTIVEHSLFTVVSIITTTGFTVVDFDSWSFGVKFLLLLLMLIGGCAGSTGGGIKAIRWIAAVKSIRLHLRRSLHPSAILHLRIGPRMFPDSTIMGIYVFVITYLLIVLLGGLALTLMGLDIETSLSASFSCTGCIGPALGMLGASETYSGVPIIGKYILMILMLLGRLEIFSVIVIVTRGFWKP